MSVLGDLVDGVGNFPIVIGAVERAGSGILWDFAKSLSVGAASALVVMYAGQQVLEERSNAFAKQIWSMETKLDRFAVLLEERQLVLDRVETVKQLQAESAEHHEHMQAFDMRLKDVEKQEQEVEAQVRDLGYWVRERNMKKR
jgi:hypothetical protein